MVYTFIFKCLIYLCCTELNPAGVRQSCFLWDGYLSSELLAICVTEVQSQPYPSIIDVSASICLCSSLILNFYPAETCTCLTHHALCPGHPTPQVQTHRSSESSLNQNLPQSCLLILPHRATLNCTKHFLDKKKSNIFLGPERRNTHLPLLQVIVMAHEVSVKCVKVYSFHNHFFCFPIYWENWEVSFSFMDQASMFLKSMKICHPSMQDLHILRLNFPIKSLTIYYIKWH